MAALTAKGLPASVQHFVHAGDRFAHLATPHASTSSASGSPASSSAFRFARSSAPAPPPDWAAFESGVPSAHDAAWSAVGASTGSTRSAAHDGAELSALLAGADLVDAVDGDWERELREKQSDPWRIEHEATLPLDPFASSAARRDTKGKGKEREIDDAAASEGQLRGVARAGDMSPTSTELLSSLSSLDLADRAYLRTLVSLDPRTAVEDYFSRGSYSDDVWGLPPGVRRLFEKATASQEGQGETSVEEGRRRAVRRLGMVFRHMQAAEQAGATLQTAAPATQVGQGQDAVMRDQQAQGQSHSAAYALNHTQHMTASSQFSVHPASHFASISAQRSDSHNFLHQNELSTALQEQYSVPSSLSGSAFITISPTASPPPPAPSAFHDMRDERMQEEEPAAALIPTAALLAQHSARLASNAGGRFGPDFRGPRSQLSDAASADADANVREGASDGIGSEMESMGLARGGAAEWAVKEGRTH
ncbi:hypothetical protein Rhopal_002831-T1 [Rhodotorula paludigena]|uniref:Uncharacterized protein n=1 Tax=Rhodotorula paludigena TaxID=86838 RepID=A0AAV5GLC2_9BASI|nr:hypothetical protein Rhopal_002831-T1 [Rhodotorula paludigena]